ncbi:MAG: 3-phosphoshikimate 1-carboxyvinyltransferase [Myxococcales bacterium]|nr:3-phosphoshikimate 1-carboxyvinyltransferase [Myxococcales bacterium]
MKFRIVGNQQPVTGHIRMPGDKSIAHRGALFSVLAKGDTTLHNFPTGIDNLTTLAMVESLGVNLLPQPNGQLVLQSPGSGRLQPLVRVFDCLNSGTTARILAGLLAGQQQEGMIVGDASLSIRPMDRVAKPLRELGARVRAEGRDGTLPLRTYMADLTGATVRLDVASAQVKTAVLLAGLGATGVTRVTEPGQSRDHSERMLREMGAPIRFGPGYAEVTGPFHAYRPLNLRIPGDPSSAAFFAVLAVLQPGSDLFIENILLSPTRAGFLRVLERMGAQIEVRNARTQSGEQVGDIRVQGSKLNATEITPDEIPGLIDELPILAVAMSLADGTSAVHGAKELRYKESDRIKSVVQGLRDFGVKANEASDGYIIEGTDSLRSAEPNPHKDHRLVMAFTIAASIARGASLIQHADTSAISFPDFQEALANLGVSIRIYQGN